MATRKRTPKVTETPKRTKASERRQLEAEARAVEATQVEEALVATEIEEVTVVADETEDAAVPSIHAIHNPQSGVRTRVTLQDFEAQFKREGFELSD